MMDSLITAAARALAAGDLLGVLKRIGLRDDPPALALRGIAMAQLGDYPRAKALLQDAARGFGPREVVARARCVVAEAEIALVSRDLGWPPDALEDARVTLQQRGDAANASHARLLQVRRLLLIGHLGAAERVLADLDPAPFPPTSRAAYELVVAGIAIRRIRAGAAHAALIRAEYAARQGGLPAQIAEVDDAFLLLRTPAARLLSNGEQRLVALDEVETVFATAALIVDACRHRVRGGTLSVELARRPVLFALARALGEAWPQDLSRDELVRLAFRARRADDSHRARLRVEIGRLRAELRPLAGISATAQGYKLTASRNQAVVVLSPPVEGQHAAVTALLADGEAWPSSALALALGASPRTVQRALEALAAAGEVQWTGRGPARRWMAAPVPGFATSLLLPGPLPSD